ncbi:MAG: phosphoglycerate kinase [Bacilli bacterium]|nr:phosphoglycerate kinase [Bacilli bacterium]
MKKTIRDFDLKNKKVIIRVDFNVPMKDGKITDDNRIRASLMTINYALANQAKVILMSHLGRIKTEEDKKDKSLKPVAVRLSELLNINVKFIDETRGDKLNKAVNSLNAGEVLLMENTRFEDLNNKAESNCDASLAKYWASLGEIFINDAFGTIHRKHASNVGISKILPSGIGFLVEKEVNNLKPIIQRPKRPLTMIMGGAKIGDKIKLIENLVKKADYLLIGGGMAFTFLKSEGYNIGSSIVDNDYLDFCSNILKEYADKIILPVDVVVAKSLDAKRTRVCDITEIKEDEIGFDIGPNTINIFKSYIDKSKTIFINGTMGVTENENFKKGTYEIAKYLEGRNTIIGGGDTAGAIINFGFKNYTHISTGGGASLELLEGKRLPGLIAIKNK